MNESFSWLGAALILSLVAAGCYGWVMNIVTIAQTEAFSGMVLLRVVGVFMAPLGAILGFM